jgi:hypothetical protein
MVNLGFEFGGDEVAELKYTDGTTSTVSAGRGLLLAAGALFDIDLGGNGLHVLDIQTLFGFKFATTKEAVNGSLTWTRWPLELFTFYHYADIPVRVGAGVTYHLWNGIGGSENLDFFDHSFNNALGFAFAADYLIESRGRMFIGLKYTLINYTSSSRPVTISANNFGINIGYSF